MTPIRSFPRAFRFLLTSGLVPAVVLVACGAPRAQETGAEAAPAPAVFDEITVKDGSRIIGQVVGLKDGKLTVDTAFGGKVEVSWAEVVDIRTAKPLTVILKDGTELKGQAAPGAAGTLQIQKGGAGPQPVALDSVTAINPPPEPMIKVKGSLSLGASLNRGNTSTRSVTFLGSLETRIAKDHRVTLGGTYNYADDGDTVTAQYGLGTAGYDYFLTKRLYLNGNLLFEHDGINDLSLRSTAGGGLGYELILEDDFTADWLKKMKLSVEAGASYVKEDYKLADDEAFPAARWAVKFEWPFVPDEVSFFHRHVGYPNLRDLGELNIITETGFQFSIWGDLVGTVQVNWRWTNTPSPGFKRGDTQLLATLGYSFQY